MSDGVTDANKPMGLQITKSTMDEISNRFTYHAPKGDQAALYAIINQAYKECAIKVAACCGGISHNREISSAITHLANSRMWANASIAINGIGAESVPKQDG